jgi:peptidoglycan/LPS O-acetylase OafA/YrhL
VGNGFDILRVAAALAVIFHHTGPLNGRPAVQLLGADFGAFGVGVFFVVSGYLVTESYRRSGDPGRYLARRALRIWPGLIVSLVLTAVVLGPLVATLAAADYFRDPQWALYILRNTLLYPVTYDLPGVFVSSPAYGVNGSLWTLRLEVSCYLGVALLGVLGRLNAASVAVLAAAAALTALVLGLARPDFAAGPGFRLLMLAARFGFLFLAGAWLQLRGRPPGLWLVAVSTALLFTPAWFIGLPAVAIRLGLLPAARLPADFSYGLYIYAFPVQQVLAEQGRLDFALSVACTLPLAVASWFLVERPMLRLKPRPRPVAGTAAALQNS